MIKFMIYIYFILNFVMFNPKITLLWRISVLDKTFLQGCGIVHNSTVPGKNREKGPTIYRRNPAKVYKELPPVCRMPVFRLFRRCFLPETHFTGNECSRAYPHGPYDRSDRSCRPDRSGKSRSHQRPDDRRQGNGRHP